MSLPEEVLRIVPVRGGPRVTLGLIAVGIGIAAASIAGAFACISWADARMERHVRPVRISQAETAAVVDHIAEHMFRPTEIEAREARGLATHDLTAIKANAREAAMKFEKEEREAYSIIGGPVP